MERGDSTDVPLGISSEEFEHYQQRFIQERSEKYALLEKVKKLENELLRVNTEKTTEFDKVLKDKLQKPFQSLLQRSKRESESESYHQDHDTLHKKLMSQEEDFQRQNMLLMQELQQLVIKNEELERKLQQQKERDGNGTAESPSSSTPLSAFSELSAEGVLRVSQLEKELSASRTTLEEKQRTITSLLSEKAQLQHQSADRISLLTAEKESLKSSYEIELNKLKAENAHLEQVAEDEKLFAKTKIEDAERQMKEIFDQMDLTSQQTRKEQELLLSEHKKQIAQLLEELDTTQTSFKSLQTQHAELKLNFEQLSTDSDALKSSQTSLAELANQRKATIDDLTTHLDSLKRDHGSELQRLLEEKTEQVKSLESQLQHVNGELSGVRENNSRLENERTTLLETQSRQESHIATLTSGLREAESLNEQLQSELTSQRSEFESRITDLTRSREKILVDYQTVLADHDALKTYMEQKEKEHAQALYDKGEEIRIAEKKSASVLRDLQKQLHSEKKRVEKLQNRLNEVLQETGVRPRSFQDETDFLEREETGSNASWSFVSPKGSVRKPTPADNASSHSKEDGDAAGVLTEREAQELVERVAKLQLEKAVLQERVTMLEAGNAAMAEDLHGKSLVIDRYLQNAPVPSHNAQQKEDIFPLRKLIDHLGREKGLDAETQKNLRRLLEETLTKNIHLQKNMELLTEELDRLRATSPPR